MRWLNRKAILTMKYIIEKLTKQNGDITYRHKENAGAFSNYSSSPTLSKSELQGFRLVSRIENWRGSGNTVFQKMEKFVFDSKGAKKAAQPAIVYRTRAKPSNPWTVLPNDSTFPDTDPFYVKEVHEDNFSTKKLAGVASSNKPCIKTEDVPEEYHGETFKATNFDFKFVHFFVQTLGNWGDVQWGAFARWLHSNDRYLWMSGHQANTGNSPIFDIEEAVANNDVSKIKFLGLQVSWGSKYTHDPLLNVNGTDIWVNVTHAHKSISTFKTTNYKNYARSNGPPTVVSTDANNGTHVMYDLINKAGVNYYDSQYSLPNLKTSDAVNIETLNLKDGGGGTSSEMGSILYENNNRIYIYNLFFGHWQNADQSTREKGYFSVASFPKSNPETISFSGRTAPLELPNKCRAPFIAKNIGGKDYLYAIPRNSPVGRVWRIDDNAALEGMTQDEDSGITPPDATLGKGEVVPHEFGIQIGNYLYSAMGTNPTADNVPWDPNNFFDGTRPSFVVTDLSQPTSPSVIKAVWTKMTDQYDSTGGAWTSNNYGNPGQFHYAEDEQLLCYVGWSGRQIFFVDVSTPSSPVLRHVEKINRDAFQASKYSVQRLTGRRSLLFIGCGFDTSFSHKVNEKYSPYAKDIEYIFLNIEGLGKILRDSNATLESDSATFKSWVKS